MLFRAACAPFFGRRRWPEPGGVPDLGVVHLLPQGSLRKRVEIIGWLCFWQIKRVKSNGKRSDGQKKLRGLCWFL